ncbi:MAG TPA: helix-turn-helix domain-containing protein [Pseudonocardiaceae bacterium]|nr:helix-turn-helix domain-containing protein [Pseudonocardiaceae bacterium]
MERARLSPLTKGRQITGPEREKIAARLRERYSQGASIRDLMAQTGRSYGWTYRMLANPAWCCVGAAVPTSLGEPIPQGVAAMPKRSRPAEPDCWTE